MAIYPQIKICGLTVPEEAAACAAMGADAIGLIFHPPSPRNLELEQAVRIAAALPSQVVAVGVFVNPDWAFLCEAIDRCSLGVVQLHGNEPPEMANRVQAELRVKVLKALFTAKAPYITSADRYALGAYLVECGKGPLPGGNAEAWDWSAAADFARAHTIALAGGLDPDNVARAIRAALPAAVDASSGLESEPGHKALRKVEQFIAAVHSTAGYYKKPGMKPQLIF